MSWKRVNRRRRYDLGLESMVKQGKINYVKQNAKHIKPFNGTMLARKSDYSNMSSIMTDDIKAKA